MASLCGTGTTTHKASLDGQECVICHDALQCRGCVYCCNCLNIFHLQCAVLWKRECPICRDCLFVETVKRQQAKMASSVSSEDSSSTDDSDDL